ncbi:hypothetical protein EKK58_01250 [Candidatus Dependentiae bacterium]|nr:MAG: hypothetical protein EKK58_01250 [Candidatus Dependentiae bacterium]
MGRPKGSKNKPKNTAVAPTIDPSTLPAAEVPKKRGRPPGSKNKAKDNIPQATKAPETNEVPKRRGRPPGSKNKPKDGGSTATPPAPTPTPPPATATPPVSTEAPKRRGRPPKTIAPTLPATPGETAPPPIPAGATKAPSVATPVVVTRTEAEDEAPEPAPRAAYTREQLNHPALDRFEEHARVFYAHASAHRKITFENKADDTLTVERAVLKTLIDFFEIDVEALIANGKKSKDTKAPEGAEAGK